MTALDLETYRRRAEEFVGALDLEYYEHFSGRKPTCDTAAVYDRYPELFTKAAIDELEGMYQAAEDEEKRRLAYLLAFTVDGFMGEQTKHLGDEVANTEGAATITVDGETIGLRQAGVVQANEADGARRGRIQEARLAATGELLNPLLDRLWRRCHELALELGYPHYRELYSEVKGLDYGLLRAELESFLGATEGLYSRVMDRLSRERMGVPFSDLAYADLPYLWRAPGFDDVFTRDGLVPALRATLAGLQIDLDAQSNVHVDTEVRKLKSPRAFCSPVRVPGEIYLVVLPQGGQEDYAALLHEAGHTEHFAHVDADLPFEYRHLGDNAVTEGFAFTFDHLVLNREWLARYLEFTDVDEYLRFANVNDLYFMRRYAAKLCLRDGASPADRLAGRHGGALLGVPQRRHDDRGPRGQLPGGRRRRLLLRELPARLDARGRLPHDPAGPVRRGLVPSIRRPGTGSRGCGRTASTSPRSACCSSTAAAGSTPTRSSTTSRTRSAGRPRRRQTRPAARRAAAPVARGLSVRPAR